MSYLPITPFRRTVDAAVIAAHKHPAPLPQAHINKWEILRQLAIARKSYGLTDRDLGVLRGMLSFYPEAELRAGNLIIHPSNLAISERMNHMPLSTLRRHIAQLVSSGFIIRRDSPNGKRYMRRVLGAPQIFGFDLTPLLSRAEEIITAAQAVTEAEQSMLALREQITLMRRDLAGLACYGQHETPDLLDWNHYVNLAERGKALLRRKTDTATLEAYKAELKTALEEVHSAFTLTENKEMSTKDYENEHHHQNSNKEYNESEELVIEPTAKSSAALKTSVPLPVVLDLCKEFKGYSLEPIHQWDQFVAIADKLCPMMGISHDLWISAKKYLGKEEAAIVLASMLERFDKIRSPGAYLNYLMKKARHGIFSAGAMLRALRSPSSVSSQL